MKISCTVPDPTLLPVRAKGKLPVYEVVETSDGLFWRYHSYHGTEYLVHLREVALPHVGHMLDKEVTPEEAEILTGLHMPAAMDRLRELVHELRSASA